MARKDAAFPARRAIKDNVGNVREGGMPPLIGIVFVDHGIERMGDVVKRRRPGIFFLKDPCMKALRTAGIDVSLKRLEDVDGLTRYRGIRERQDVESMIHGPNGEFETEYSLCRIREDDDVELRQEYSLCQIREDEDVDLRHRVFSGSNG